MRHPGRQEFRVQYFFQHFKRYRPAWLTGWLLSPNLFAPKFLGMLEATDDNKIFFTLLKIFGRQVKVHISAEMVYATA